jgi:hypothetical protein
LQSSCQEGVVGQEAWEACGLHLQLLLLLLDADLQLAAEAAVSLPAAPAVLQ